jgi:hypothetical protein
VAVAVVAGVIAGALALTGGDGKDQRKQRATTDSRSEVIRVLRGYARAFTAKDTDGLRRLFAANVTRHGLRQGGCSDTTGRQAVLETYEEQFHGGSTDYRLKDLQRSNVHISGRRATLRSRYTISTGGAGTIRFELRRAESRWRITRVVAPC